MREFCGIPAGCKKGTFVSKFSENKRKLREIQPGSMDLKKNELLVAELHQITVNVYLFCKTKKVSWKDWRYSGQSLKQMF